MTILNMAWWWGNNINVPLNWISNLTASSWDWQSVIKRTDVWDLVVNWVTVNEWSCTKLVRKTGSAPASSNDWTPVLTETLENAYSVTWYTNTGLTNGTTYYYWAFSVGTNGLETISNIATVTPSASWWQPWVNTIAYFPLENNSNEASWKTVTTADTSVNYSTLWWVKCANTTSWYINVSTSIFDDSSARTEQTMSFWMYLNSMPSWTSEWAFEFEKQNNYSFYFLARSNNVYRHEWTNAWSTIDVSIPSSDIWTRVYFTLVNSASWKYMYKNWVLIWSWTWSSRPRWNWPHPWAQNMVILSDRDRVESLNWGLRELIFEDKTWTDQEIQDYFDATKWDYWIS